MSTHGKRIGFVDYKLENFHANVFLTQIREKLAARGYGVAGCYALEAADGRAWAEKNGVTWHENPESLNAAVDCFMILAPSNPETHLPLCQRFLPFHKPTYVDKTFAPDLATAEQIFALADQHGVAMQTSSALRYTNIQAYAKQAGRVEQMVAWGGGRSFEEYAIHPVEMVVSCMGPAVKQLMRRGDETYSQLLLDYADGRTAVANVYTAGANPFAAGVTTSTGTKLLPVDTSVLWTDTAGAILDFFEARRPLVDRAESLAIRRVLDAARRAEARQGFVAV